MRLWDTKSGRCETTLNGHCDGVRCLTSVDGFIASGGYDDEARLWDVRKKQCIQVFKGHRATIYTIALGAERLATGAEDGEVRVWDRQSGFVLRSPFANTILLVECLLKPR